MTAAGAVPWLGPTVALPTGEFRVVAASHAVRGFGYPLFAYGFLVWVAASVPAAPGARRGVVLARLRARPPDPGLGRREPRRPRAGAETVLVAAGAVVGLFGPRDPVGRRPLSPGTAVTDEPPAG